MPSRRACSPMMALALGTLFGCGASSKPPDEPAAAPPPSPPPPVAASPRPPAIVQPRPPVIPEPPEEVEAVVPDGLIRFDDLQDACGDLPAGRSFLCLVNQGFERVPGGRRLVIADNEASFTFNAWKRDGEVSITVLSEGRYSLIFGPPKGRPFVRGLYSNTVRSSANENPFARMDISLGSSRCDVEGGQFLVRRMVHSGEKLIGFEADFETPCAQGTGRISFGTSGTNSPFKVEKRDGKMVISDP